MRTFYYKKNNCIIITPYRCGSSFLDNNKDLLGLEKLKIQSMCYDDLDNLEEYKTSPQYMRSREILDEVDYKIFLFRNPIERFYSVYDSFIYTVPGEESFVSRKSYRRLESNLLHEFYVKEMYINFYKIKKAYKTDPHLSPQIVFFKFYEQEPRRYDIIDFTSYNSFLKQMFGNKIINLYKNSSPANRPIRLFDVHYIMEINNRLQEIYREDFDKLTPLARLI